MTATATRATKLAAIRDALDAADVTYSRTPDAFEVSTPDGDTAIISAWGDFFVVTVYAYRANRETWWNDEHEERFTTATEAVEYATGFGGEVE